MTTEQIELRAALLYEFIADRLRLNLRLDLIEVLGLAAVPERRLVAVMHAYAKRRFEEVYE